MVYSKEQLADFNQLELRRLARELGVRNVTSLNSAALIDYKDEAGRGGYSLSFDYRVPRFPYNMVRVDDASQSAVSPASVPASAPVSTKIVKSSRNWSLPRFVK